MSQYTVLNLKDDVEDSAPKFGYSPDLEARFARPALELEKSGISYQKLAPGFRVPFGHRHKHQEELYVVVSGSGRIKIDDEILDIKQWDAVRVPPERWRNWEAGPDGIEIIAFGAPVEASHEGAEMSPGWWSD